MTGKQWYYAQLRWAVMVEGKQGLREWQDVVHLFLAEDEQTAFQQALEIGRQGEDIHTEGRREVETRLAEIVRLDCLGCRQEVRLQASVARITYRDDDALVLHGQIFLIRQMRCF